MNRIPLSVGTPTVWGGVNLGRTQNLPVRFLSQSTERAINRKAHKTIAIIAGSWGVVITGGCVSYIRHYRSFDEKHGYITRAMQQAQNDASIQQHLGKPVEIEPYRKGTIDSVGPYAMSELKLKGPFGTGTLHVCARRKEPDLNPDLDQDVEEDDDEVSFRGKPYLIKRAVIQFLKKVISGREERQGIADVAEGAPELTTTAAETLANQWQIDAIFCSVNLAQTGTSIINATGDGSVASEGLGGGFVQRLLSLASVAAADVARVLSGFKAPKKIIAVQGDPTMHPSLVLCLPRNDIDPDLTRRRSQSLFYTGLLVGAAAVAALTVAGNRLWVARRQLMGKKFVEFFAQTHPDIRKQLRTDNIGIIGMSGVFKPRYIDGAVHMSTTMGLSRLELVAARADLNVPYNVIKSQLSFTNGKIVKLDPALVSD
eukprot:GHVQ01029020.1.p1 GENE.GHVQ01029020.1~~GHVQ01029020.1.p1  ORF type:complete len:428 (-),score=46.30 GHVQ01029020.1:961-2244(-)